MFISFLLEKIVSIYLTRWNYNKSLLLSDIWILLIQKQFEKILQIHNGYLILIDFYLLLNIDGFFILTRKNFDVFRREES